MLTIKTHFSNSSSRMCRTAVQPIPAKTPHHSVGIVSWHETVHLNNLGERDSPRIMHFELLKSTQMKRRIYAGASHHFAAYCRLGKNGDYYTIIAFLILASVTPEQIQRRCYRLKSCSIAFNTMLVYWHSRFRWPSRILAAKRKASQAELKSNDRKWLPAILPTT